MYLQAQVVCNCMQRQNTHFNTRDELLLEKLPSVQDRRQTDHVSFHWPRLLPFITRCFPEYRQVSCPRCRRHILCVRFENALSRPKWCFCGVRTGKVNLDFQSQLAMVMTHTQAKYQGQRSGSSRVEMDGHE